MSTLFSVMLALLAGVSIVISRSINALLAEKSAPCPAAFSIMQQGL